MTFGKTTISPQPSTTNPIGGNNAQPEVLWQIPAKGYQHLNIDETLDLADWLDEHEGNEFLEFILMDPPEAVAADLRLAATEAKLDQAKKNERAAERELEALRQEYEQ